MDIFKKIFFLLLILAISVSCDQTTKALAKTHLKANPPIIYWNDLVRLQYSENPGAFLGLGANFPEEVRFLLFTLFTGVILLGLFIFVLVNHSIGPWITLAFSLVIGGGMSNLLDRMLYNGRVVDFMNIGVETPWGPVRSGIFNVADMAITGGVIFLFLLSFNSNNEAESETKSDMATAA